MKIAVDTSVIIAVIADEPEKAKLIELTKGSSIRDTSLSQMGSRECLFSDDETLTGKSRTSH